MFVKLFILLFGSSGKEYTVSDRCYFFCGAGRKKRGKRGGMGNGEMTIIQRIYLWRFLSRIRDFSVLQVR